MTGSLQNRLNSLESKYMDLANYYKQGSSQQHLGSQSTVSDGQTSAVGGVVSNANSNYQGGNGGMQSQPS